LLYTNTGQTITSNQALVSLTVFVVGGKAIEMETVKNIDQCTE
jgi:hypothetical protein